MKLLVIGSGVPKIEALRVARGLGRYTDIVDLEIYAADGFNFSLPDLTPYSEEGMELFLAMDDRGINMSRTQLFSALKAKGTKMARLVAADVYLPANVTVGENTLIAEGVSIDHGVTIGYNSYIDRGVILPRDTKIGNCVFIGRDASIGSQSVIGDFSSIGPGLELANGTTLGKYCELRQKRTYGGQIPEKTFYLDLFDEPVRIISPL